MAVPPLFVPECHVDTALTRALLLYRHDFDDFINHQHGVPKVAAEMVRQWKLFGTSRQVVGIVDRDKKLANVAYLDEFDDEVGGSQAADAPHSIRRHPTRPNHALIVLNPACDTWVWQASEAAGLSLSSYGLPTEYWAFIDYCKGKGVENLPSLTNLLVAIRRSRPAVYTELGNFVAEVMDIDRTLS